MRLKPKKSKIFGPRNFKEFLGDKKAQEEIFGFVIVIIILIIIGVIIMAIFIKPSKPITQNSPMAYSFLTSVMNYNTDCGTIEEVSKKCRKQESCFLDLEENQETYDSCTYLSEELDKILGVLGQELYNGAIEGYLFTFYETDENTGDVEFYRAGGEIESKGYFSAEYSFKITTYRNGKVVLQLFT